MQLLNYCTPEFVVIWDVKEQRPGPYPGFYFNRGKNHAQFPFPFPLLPLSFSFVRFSPFPIDPSPALSPLPFPFPSHSPSNFPFSFFPFPSPPLLSGDPTPLIQLEGLWEHCKLLQRVRAEPDQQMVSDTFWAEKSASGDNNQFEVFCETSCQSLTPGLKFMQRNKKIC